LTRSVRIGTLPPVPIPPPGLRFKVSPEQGGERLDHLVAVATGVSRRVARTLIATGRVSVGAKTIRILTRPVRAGVEISISAGTGSGTGEEAPATGAPGRERGAGAVPVREHPALGVLFVDKYLLVVDKPAGLLSEHDRFGSPSVESLAPQMLAARGEKGERTHVWLVHRLDAGTSGVLLLARTPMAAQVLGDAFRGRDVEKRYLALCRGRLEGEPVVDAPIARAERTRHVVAADGKPARTRLRALAATDTASLVEAVPETGRTHQIRVHLTHLGHPLWGDGLYGGPMYTPGAGARPVPRPMLHARELRLAHPKTREPLRFAAPPPADLVALARELGLAAPLEQEGR
jgi:23S rRNA pseudouridine1911/1915/1917 synthase